MSESALPRRGGFSTAVDLETEEGRTFLQERLALFGKVGFILSIGAFCVVNLSLALLGLHAHARAWPLRPKSPLVLGAALVFLGGWLLCRRGRLPRRPLDLVEAGLVVGVCAVPSLIVLLLSPQVPTLGYTMLLLVTNVLVARSLYVPSRPLRTLQVSLAATVFPLAAAASQPSSVTAPSALGVPLFLIESAVWFVCATATSTLASALIFGLRQKVREARRLGQYTLDEKVGEGGMGIVH